MNRRALGFIIPRLIPILPAELTAGWEEVPTRPLDLSDNRTIRKTPEERFTCPKCDGVDERCSLCGSSPYHPWDGTVSKRLANKYHRRLTEGGTWE